MFIDRTDAGRRLLERLPDLDPGATVILALPRGGVPVAAVIARSLGAPLDLALVRKVGFPGHPELALAAVSDGSDPQIAVNREVARMSGLDQAEIEALAEEQLAEIRRRRELYLKGRTPVPIAGKTVVVVDDGVATGATMRAALRLLRGAGPARLIAAVPVAPPDIVAELAGECDEVIALETPQPFGSVGAYYKVFDQVPDAAVSEILKSHLHSGEAGQAAQR